MAVIFRESFASYNGVGVNPGIQASWTPNVNTGTPFSLIAGRFGDQALRVTINGTGQVGALRRAFDSNVATFGVHVAMRWSSLAALLSPYMDLCLLDSALGYQLGIRVNNLGQIELYRLTSSIAGTLLGVSAIGTIQPNVWYGVSLETLVSDTVGAPVVKVNGAAVISLTNQDTKNTANANVGAIELGNPTGNAARIVTIDYDDIYAIDALNIPERRIEQLLPNADGGTLNWTQSTGATHFGVVDEGIVNSTDWLQASTVGNIDLLGIQDLSSTPQNIDEVNVVMWSQKTDATSRSIAAGVKSGATTSDGPNFAQAVGFAKYERRIALDPNTAAAWTPAAVNALELQPKVTV